MFVFCHLACFLKLQCVELSGPPYIWTFECCVLYECVKFTFIKGNFQYLSTYFLHFFHDDFGHDKISLTDFCCIDRERSATSLLQLSKTHVISMTESKQKESGPFGNLCNCCSNCSKLHSSCKAVRCNWSLVAAS